MDLSILNDRQLKAVTTIEGPLLVLAGAGSGKTRVLTYRIGHLIDRYDVKPYHILALTFTNKAANEMKQRVAALVGYRAEQITMGTFHSFCLLVLRRNADQIGYRSDFLVYDAGDQRTLVKNVMKELKISEKDISISNAKAVISDAKNKLTSVEKFQDLYRDDYHNKRIGLIYERYQAHLRENNAMDFDDLIVNVIQLFRNAPDVLEYYQHKFKYIHVDEYQDTNYIQYLLVKQLSEYYNNICVVGDGDQSIYGWRGADIGNIRDFEKTFKNAKVVLLEQNYRSTQNILDLANGVIKNNLARRDKNLWTDNAAGDLIQYYRAADGEDEARFVANQIIRGIEGGGAYGEYAILYRTNAQSRSFENAFNRASIPYKIVGGRKFYERMEIKDLMAYLRFVANPSDAVSLRRIINVPKRGIGAQTMTHVEQIAQTRQLSLYQAIVYAVENAALSARAIKGLKGFCDFVQPLIDDRAELTGSEILKAIIEQSGYRDNLEMERTTQAEARLENIDELYNQIVEFEQKNETTELNYFLQEISLLSDQDDIEEDESGQVLLMTIHAAKGLEFPVVFLVGMEERLFPSGRALEDDDGLAEERRLCYVGITRAQRRLYISHAEMRSQYGALRVNQVSRFIEEMPHAIIESHSGTITARKAQGGKMALNYKRYAAKPLAKADDNAYKPGMRVHHQHFGEGVVIALNGETTLTIAFDKKGIKKLAVGFAPLRIIEE